ncbi:MAG: hypothetical protein ACK4YL_25470 [Microcystis sp.]|uniref:Uncharacterized protein n=1 Tax=Microcystis aeruginosa PCC 9701 TaxID=721123 RepID=I4INK8_MICAE|nr:hypothetical protein [Microcystis aeruginosa]MCE2670391.1 hypothetical protein [Microcystis sp. 49638_E5]MCZ8053663.1 hypothetical protein [Microcystis sp. LE19-12.2C]MDJ0552377.1 hypothetical protein [Microcystis sp. M49637_WE12]MDJ0587604.1 hypothetical protein [Microcystis sp. M49636_WE2]CCI35882.1 hypothetical protein MICAK_20010 [Microcystis aeruginosa PCC 9701]
MKTEKGIGASPDEKIFTPTGERGFFPYTPHPTPYTLFSVRRQIHNTFACSGVP